MNAPILNHLVIGKETTFNTPVVPSIAFPIERDGGLTTNPQRQYLELLRAQLAKFYGAVDGARTHSGNYKTQLLHDVIGHVLLSSLGGVSSAVKSGESIVYEHEFTEGASKKSYTVEQKLGDIVRRYSGVFFPSFKIVAEPNGAINMEFAAIGAGNNSASPVTPGYTDELPFTFDEIAIDIDTVAITSGVRKLELEYKNNAESIHSLGSKDPRNHVIGGSEIDLTMELILDATMADEYVDMLNNADKGLDLTITGAATIGTASNNKLELSIPELKYTTGEITFADDGVVILPIVASAISTSGSLFDLVRLTNLIASY